MITDLTPAEKLQRIRRALEHSGEFNNYECDYGYTLGRCPNIGCVHCTVHRLSAESYDSEFDRLQKQIDEDPSAPES